MDMADQVEATTRRTSLSVADRMAPTIRDYSAEVVDQKATVVRVDRVDLLEVEDEAGQAMRLPRARLAALAENLAFSPLYLAHTGGCAVRWGRMSWRFSSVGGKPSEVSKPAMCNVTHPHVVFISCQ